MTDNGFSQIEAWADAKLQRLTSPERSKLTRRIAIELRRRQQQRIAQQKNPDGSAYEPRSEAAQRSGRIRRRAMFMRAKSARHLRVRGDQSQAEVGFTATSARIMRVHQFGERDQVARGVFVRYPRRELLGFSDDDLRWLHETLMHYFSPE